MEALKSEVLPKVEAEFIEKILTRISDDFGRAEQFNAAYLYDRTVKHFRSREIANLGEELQDLVERGEVDEADEAARSYRPQSWVTTRGLELGSEAGLVRMEQAFAEAAQPIVRYPGALGDLMNEHLVRDGFVAILAGEKKGKTWVLLDLAFRVLRQKANVAFFQAGDLTEGQMLRRIGIHLSRRSDSERYCQPYWRAEGDCLLNQYDSCHRPDRNCDHGIYDGDVDEFDPKVSETYDNLRVRAESSPSYRPCDAIGCKLRRPTVWLVHEPERTPLSGAMAARRAREFFERNRRRFKLATYASGVLTCAEIDGCLDEWERQDDFVADVVIVDYADLMSAKVQEFRHRQNEIWQGLRGISQRRHALLVTATQADAASYRQNRLNLSNFSEDKRKNAHVTAMWGLNQSPDGREKRLGILRVNTLLAREGESGPDDEVVILQDLRSGRPFLGSYRVGGPRGD